MKEGGRERRMKTRKGKKGVKQIKTLKEKKGEKIFSGGVTAQPWGRTLGALLLLLSVGAQILTLPGGFVLPTMGLSLGLSTPWESMKGKRGV